MCWFIYYGMPRWIESAFFEDISFFWRQYLKWRRKMRRSNQTPTNQEIQFFCVTQKLTMFRKPVSLKKWNKIFSIITANKTLSPNWIVLEGYIQARKFIFVLDFRTFVIDFFVWRIFQKKLLEIFSNYIIRYNRPPTRSPSGYYTS